MILGSFNFEDFVYIDSEEGIKHPDVYAHELTHYTISQNSMVGMLMLVIKQVAEQRDFRLRSVLKELHDASVVTQEMTAMYAQYMTHLMIHEGALAAEYEKSFKESDYYRKYCLADFNILVNNPQYEEDGLYSLIELAIVAMNIDYSELKEIDWVDRKTLQKAILRNPIKYYPDFRYRKLVKTWIHQMKNGEQVDIEEIAAEAGIPNHTADYKSVHAMVSRLCHQLSEQCGLQYNDLFGGVVKLNSESEIAKTFDDREITQRIIPKVLNSKYRFPPTEIELMNNWVQTACVALHDSNMKNWGIGVDDRVIDAMVLHHSVAGWHYPVFTERQASVQYIAQFPGEIISFYEDYDRFRLETGLPKEKRVFYLFEGQWRRFVRWVLSLNMRYLYIHQINQDVYCAFATNQGHDVCFTIQSAMNLQNIFQSVENGDFAYVNIPKGENTDGIFYLTNSDWYRFEDVIGAMLNINLMDNTNGFQAVGRRVVYDD